jgi:hypothetical protein
MRGTGNSLVCGTYTMITLYLGERVMPICDLPEISRSFPGLVGTKRNCSVSSCGPSPAGLAVGTIVTTPGGRNVERLFSTATEQPLKTQA